MSWSSFSELPVLMVLLLAITKPLGFYMARVFQGRPAFLSPLLRPVERAIYRVCGVDSSAEQTWTAYAGACLWFGLVNFLLFYAQLRWQHWLPLNPQGFAAMAPDLAFNTAVSFLTNTSWQAYFGESTVSHLSQMAGVAVQSFTSAAAGMAVAAALIRGFARQGTGRLGNFWVDLTRSILYVLLPLSLLGALILGSQGVIQNFAANRQVAALEGGRQTIAMGPVASQESIKLLSSDGGGFFNANSAHPFENPTPFANLVEMLLILAIPAALTYTFGRMTGDTRQGWTLFAAMSVLFVCGSCAIIWSERAGNPLLGALGVESGNMEGKEVRFGVAASGLFSEVSTASSDGAVNSAHDSYTPLAGLVQMINLKSGEVIFGGTGSGIVSMLLTVLVAVFLAGLMVGRTPEYLGKKIESREMKMVMLAYVITALATLVFSCLPFAGLVTAGLGNPGPHGLSEILYAYGSAAGTNGSAMAGLNSNTPWFNLTLGLGMLVGRFAVIIPALAIAGSLAKKRRAEATFGTMPTHGPLFAAMLMATVLLVTALTFLPAFSLGPVAENLLMRSGVVFR
ncbi:MAG TPA: potassium-transporting ATPase subunit KdpA [Bryobacteraceae bacterium]|nr:potassium translocating ATPase, subunit A [Candidatus Sulfopaludibacter sp. SbA4]HYW43177.1 potassium-transporting ATPase subunit KdpA [Bryobacteraceae bacterium]